MSKFRFLFSALVISIGMLVAEPFTSLDVSFAQSIQELDKAARLDKQAVQLSEQGRYAEAEPLFKRSLAILEKALGPDHEYVALSLISLAKLYVEQDRHAEAEPLYKRALAIREKTLGPNHPDSLRIATIAREHAPIP